MKPSASADIIVVEMGSVEHRGRKSGDDLHHAFHGDEMCWTGVRSFPKCRWEGRA